jgi:putative oxidoreductase
VKNRSFDWTQLTLRVVLGLVMFPHGAQKLFGWFGGYGFQGTMGFLTGMGIPYPVAVLVILAEALGSLALVLGLLTRLSALGIVAVMIGAVATTHLGNGFFMNWAGSQAGEGYEYHLLALGLALPLVAFGGGRFSLDALLRRDRTEADEHVVLKAA